MDVATPTAQIGLTVSPDAARDPHRDVHRWCDVDDFAPIRGRLTLRAGDALTFRFALDVDHEILWSGATPTRTTLHASTAVARFDEPGEHVVRAEVYGLDQRLIATFAAFVDVVGDTHGASQNRHREPAVRSPTDPASS